MWSAGDWLGLEIPLKRDTETRPHHLDRYVGQYHKAFADFWLGRMLPIVSTSDCRYPCTHATSTHWTMCQHRHWWSLATCSRGWNGVSVSSPPPSWLIYEWWKTRGRKFGGSGQHNQNDILNRETVVNGELEPHIKVLEQFGDFFWGENWYGLTWPTGQGKKEIFLKFQFIGDLLHPWSILHASLSRKINEYYLRYIQNFLEGLKNKRNNKKQCHSKGQGLLVIVIPLI